MILNAAETVLGYFGFDRTLYGNKKNTLKRKQRKLSLIHPMTSSTLAAIHEFLHSWNIINQLRPKA
jgi:hypothetical protein